MRCSIKLCAGLHLLVSVTMVIFGRGVAPIWQGLFGTIFSIEGYQGATELQPNRVRMFLASLFVSVAVSAWLGVEAMQNDKPVECQDTFTLRKVVRASLDNGTFSGNDDVQSNIYYNISCLTSYDLYAYLELLGGACLGVVLIISVALSMEELRSATRIRSKRRDDRREWEYENSPFMF